MAVAVYVTVGRTNRDPVALADVARRQANLLGPDGFSAMRGQTDERFRKHGNLRFVFSSLRTARAFQERVEENCDDSVSTERKIIGKKRS